MKLHLYKALKLKFKIGLDCVVGDAGGIYVGDSYKTIYALETDDYRVRWEMPAKGFEPKVLAGDVLVLGGDRVTGLRGVDIRTGAPRWTSAPGVAFGHCDIWRNGLLRAYAVSRHRGPLHRPGHRPGVGGDPVRWLGHLPRGPSSALHPR